MKGLVFDIEKFAVHDGPGIRTVIFLKGCPLHCLWCHNPESQSFEREILFTAQNCTRCGRCAAACPHQCHTIQDNIHTFDRTSCVLCGKCLEKCYAEALSVAGKEMTVEEVMAEVRKDLLFFRNSGGGITLSGGEPLSHPAFAAELLRTAKAEGIHTAVETSGFAAEQIVKELTGPVDLWLWDIKALPEQYEALTGGDWRIIERNLQTVSASGGTIHLRCPLIPGCNDSDSNLRFIAQIADRTPGVERIDLEPYHTLGESKNIRLGKDPAFSARTYEKEELTALADRLRSLTAIPVHGA